jgi:hypothetical protein
MAVQGVAGRNRGTPSEGIAMHEPTVVPRGDDPPLSFAGAALRTCRMVKAA